MPKFVIERTVPGAAQLTDGEIREASLRSLEVLRTLGPDIQWIHSFICDDKDLGGDVAVTSTGASRGNRPAG